MANALPILLLGGAAVLMMGGKKKPKAVCRNIKTAEDFTRVMGSKARVRFPAAIVYYPDDVTAEKAEMFCRLTTIENVTVIIVRASDYNRWSGEKIQPGIAIMRSSSNSEFRTWSELLLS